MLMRRMLQIMLCCCYGHHRLMLLLWVWAWLVNNDLHVHIDGVLDHLFHLISSTNSSRIVTRNNIDSSSCWSIGPHTHNVSHDPTAVNCQKVCVRSHTTEGSRYDNTQSDQDTQIRGKWLIHISLINAHHHDIIRITSYQKDTIWWCHHIGLIVILLCSHHLIIMIR